MMKKICFFLMMALMPMMASAQQATGVAQTASQPSTFRFGYFSFDEVFHSMPGYAVAKHNVDDLRIKYDEETKRVEDEFNSKYEEFLERQRSLAPTILAKRQAELAELLQKNIAFKEEANRLLLQAEESAYAPLKNKIKAALQTIGKARGYAFILNTDANALPYMDATMGEDVSDLLKEALK